jgi:regulation of enolase protein 1 (concanavalin A-like superfamily)
MMTDKVFGREDYTWFNEPATWAASGNALDLVTDGKTDFWRETHYGFIRDNGHLLAFETEAGFTAQLRVQANFEELYDQAGLMVRLDERNWIKAGIEFSDGQAMLSSVLTRDQSDWTTSPFAGNAKDFWLRVTVKAGVLRLQVSMDGRLWPLVRLAPFPMASRYWVGPMCCTPERAGLKVRFSEFRLEASLDRDLHDLS